MQAATTLKCESLQELQVFGASKTNILLGTLTYLLKNITQKIKFFALLYTLECDKFCGLWNKPVPGSWEDLAQQQMSLQF